MIQNLVMFEKLTCDWCFNKQNELKEYSYYTNPFNDTPYVAEICDECYNSAITEGIDNNHWCEICGREIAHNTGYRINMRYNYDIEGYECVRCLQEKWLKEGMDSFNDADFFDYDELSENGWSEYDSYFCRSKQSYLEVERVFNELQEKYMVINNIRASGLGLEHHLSLYIKERD